MIIVKLIVVFCCVNGFSAIPNDFCEICLNHTLCKYKVQGPGPSCTSYESSAKLKNRDIKELLNRINARRNFVAMGYSKILPHAANMKKIRWSNELASFAQRWADQCDPAIQPDREDQCRDLENLTVGQNIGSVLGPSPGLSVKGYVEMWFIQVLNYEGSVTYYNKSRDYSASYLTQLLWATTEFVGCGKVKFYVDERNVMLERLVCNFAPKGNTHGKPVYSIGYPGTQCKTGMVPDDQYRGLCSYEDDTIHAKLSNEDRPINGLLRILNLSNYSVKHEIDPIRNNLRQSNVNHNSSNQQRNQKTRHIFPNKSNYAAVKTIPQFRKQMVGNTFMNISGSNNEYLYQHDRGHSHLYHGHEPLQRNYDTTILLNTNQDFRRYDDTTKPVNSYAHTNFRKFNQYAQCTRRIRPIQENCALNQCTTATPTCYQQTTMCPFTCTEISCTPAEDHTCFTPYIPPLPDPYACTQPPCHATSTNCNYNTKCPCRAACSANTCCLTTVCPGPRRQDNNLNDYRRADLLQYYDMFPNVVVRSGDRKITLEHSTPKDTSFYSDNNKSIKAMNDEQDSDQIHKAAPPDHSKYKSQERDYMYQSFNSGLRRKRKPEDPAKPFWQIENLNRQKPPQLKSMRFTTLPNRKSRKYIDSTKLLTSTEPITLRLADYADYQPEHITEKYLSFNELMHLRKISDGFAHYDFRRNQKGGKQPQKQDKNQGKGPNKNTEKKENDTKKDPAKKEKDAQSKKDPEKKEKDAQSKKDPEKKEKDTKKDPEKKEKDAHKKPEKKEKETNKDVEKKEKDAHKEPEKKEKDTNKDKEKDVKRDPETKKENEPLPPVKPLFERINYCTRKLTCTWTAYTSQGENGENDGNRGPAFGPEIGSRTPPGYVEGCTRTSTCTRDFLDRNKMTTLPYSDQDSSESPPQDEDYCERRSLNVQRRHSDIKKQLSHLET